MSKKDCRAKMNTELAVQDAREAIVKAFDALSKPKNDEVSCLYALLAATQAVIHAQTEVCPDCFGEKYIYSSETDFKETSSCPTCKGRGRMIKERT